MLRKLNFLILVFLLLFAWSGICFAEQASVSVEEESQWDVSVKQYHLDGNADFWLYYPSPNPNVISQLHAPQKQTMNVFEVKYKFCKDQYLRLNYGTTGASNKGQGFDADWQNASNYSQITDYGKMNFYGEQKNYNLDYGYKIGNTAESTTYAFIGWTQHKSTNELRDIVYYREGNVDITPTPQAVYGAYYNMDFKGYRIGLEHTYCISPKITINGLAAVNFINANLDGLWTNHTPAWAFKDEGTATGYELNFGAKYQINTCLNANFGETWPILS